MYSLRPYQQETLEKLRTSMASGNKRILLVLPTGAGKMSILTYMAHKAAKKGKRTYLCFHVQELCFQAMDWLQKWQARYGVIMASERQNDPDALIQVCMVQTISKRLDKVPVPDMIIRDEAHHASSNTDRKLIATWPNAHVIGFTASPIRLSAEALLEDGLFQDMIMGPDVQWLTDNGYLSPAKLLTQPEQLDLSKVRITGGDFNEADLDKLFTEEIIGKQCGNAIEEYRKYCDGKPALAICSSVAHAERVSDMFRAAGYKAQCVHGGMGREERKAIVDGFRLGNIHILTFCQVFSEGTDLPAAAALFFLRPTASLVVWLQACGRVLRVAEGKDLAYIFDHVGNAKRQFFGMPMGHPAEKRDWKEIILAQEEARAKKAKKPFQRVYRRCSKCLEICDAKATMCPSCGNNFAEEFARKEQEAEIQAALEEYKRQEDVKKQNKEIAKLQTYDDFVEYGKMKGYKTGWAFIRWNMRNKNRSSK